MFLFDEPNSALTQEESKDLFRRMHLLADAGNVVLLVSHRIAELAEHTDRVALILDGVCTDLLEGEALTPDGIAAGLVSGQATRDPDEPVAARAEGAGTGLRLTGWTHAGGEFEGIDLHVKVGEIVSIVGVEGSGARELVRSIAGFERTTGRGRGRGSPRRIRRGDRTSLVSADRHTSLFSQPDDRRQHGVPPRSGDHDRRRSRCGDGGCSRSRTSCATQFRVKAASVRAADPLACRAATSRRSPSRRRS